MFGSRVFCFYFFFVVVVVSKRKKNFMYRRFFKLEAYNALKKYLLMNVV
jgi:hypothetical protein